MKRSIMITTCAAACICGVLSAGQNDKPSLYIYLPRTVKTSNEHLTLGEMGILRGSDEDLRKASAIPMGRAPFSKETIIIDRATVLSRLAAHGFAKQTVHLTGAKKVIVSRDEKIFTAEEILNASKAFLTADRPGPAGCGWRLISRVRSLPAPAATGDTSLKVSLGEDPPAGHVKLRVSASGGGIALAHQDVLFKLTYPTRQAVVKKFLKAGETITPENTEIRTVTSDTQPEANWTPPFGTVTTRNIRAGAVLLKKAVRTPAAPILVRRNQPVIMTISGVGFIITGKAIALQDGRPGQFIRVRNTDSQRIIVAKVLHDGTVGPAIGR